MTASSVPLHQASTCHSAAKVGCATYSSLISSAATNPLIHWMRTLRFSPLLLATQKVDP
jgi:hypothetical protein